MTDDGGNCVWKIGYTYDDVDAAAEPYSAYIWMLSAAANDIL
jgi:hypothetical protein